MKLPIPADAIAQHAIVLGKTGSGKSSKLRVIVEYLLAKRLPVTILDPKGDWWGLKAESGGKKPGFDVLIFGGEHADIPIDRRSGVHVAEFLAATNTSAIIDLGGWMPAERTEFFIDFASTTFKLPRAAHHLVIDEVHNFAPQGKVLDVNAGKALHWGNRIASEGRGKGITLLSASQRPQKVHKDFVTSNETLIACRVIHPLDRKAIQEWMDGFDPKLGRQVTQSLANMQRNEAWVWSPEIDYGPVKVDWPMFSTYDSFSPQNAKAKINVPMAEFDLVKVKEKFGRLIEEKESNDPDKLKARIREIEAKGSGPPPAKLMQEYAKYEARGFERGFRVANEQIADEVRAHNDRLRAWHGVLTTATAGIPVLGGISVRLPKLPKADQWTPKQIAAAKPPARASSNGALPVGETAVLRALIQYPDGLDRSQLTVLTGYKRSTRDAYIARLRDKGYAADSGEAILATDEGMAAMPDAEPLPTGQALRDYWFAKLPAGERAILETLCAHYPRAVDRDQVSMETDFKRSTRDAYLSRLAAKELVTEPGRGMVMASETLF